MDTVLFQDHLIVCAIKTIPGKAVKFPDENNIKQLFAAVFRAIFSRPKEVIIGAVAQYTIMPVVAWVLCKVMNLPADLALGVILVGCCPGGTASNVITYIAGGDVALSVGMTIVSTLAAPVMTPFLVYILAGAWVEVSFWAMVLSVVKVILVPVLLGILLRTLAGDHVDKVSDVMPLISVVAIVMIIGGIVAINAEKILSCGVLVLGVVAQGHAHRKGKLPHAPVLPRDLVTNDLRIHSHQQAHNMPPVGLCILIPAS